MADAGGTRCYRLGHAWGLCRWPEVMGIAMRGPGQSRCWRVTTAMGTP